MAKIFTEEHRAKLSNALRKNWDNPEYKKMMSDRHKGQIAWNKNRKSPEHSGERHHEWKGDDVGYQALHGWVYRQLGKPSKCENCNTTTAKKFHWANISREYKRDILDWKRLCASCHYHYDDLGAKRWKAKYEKEAGGRLPF